MAGGVTITVDTSQVAALALRAAAASREVVTVVELIVEDTAEEVKRTAEALAPLGPTGDLKASIQVRSSGLDAEVYTDLRYARFVEYGTYKDPVQPFMAPALDAQERKFPAEIQAKVTASVKALLG